MDTINDYSSTIDSYDTTREYLTTVEYSVFNDAFIHFNVYLFDSELMPCLITLNNRNKHSMGFYSHEKFASRKSEDDQVAEIALNPDHFIGQEDIEILSTLVHEMVHLWQYQTGAPSRGYHNREWAAKMESIGLMPSNTGKPGGKRTGSKMSEYILEGQAFEKEARKFLDENQLTWQSNRTPKTKPKDASKTKLHCGACGLNAWAKLDAVLICGNCGLVMPKAEKIWK